MFHDRANCRAKGCVFGQTMSSFASGFVPTSSNLCAGRIHFDIVEDDVFAKHSHRVLVLDRTNIHSILINIIVTIRFVIREENSLLQERYATPRPAKSIYGARVVSEETGDRR